MGFLVAEPGRLLSVHIRGIEDAPSPETGTDETVSLPAELRAFLARQLAAAIVADIRGLKPMAKSPRGTNHERATPLPPQIVVTGPSPDSKIDMERRRF
jgi:hypothetical protein